MHWQWNIIGVLEETYIWTDMKRFLRSLASIIVTSNREIVTVTEIPHPRIIEWIWIVLDVVWLKWMIESSVIARTLVYPHSYNILLL